MSRDLDPLLRATAGGDPACPDGQALAALGRLVRDASRPPAGSDLARAVLAKLDAGPQALPSDEVAGFLAAVDALYDGDAGAASSAAASHPDLARLGDLVRSAAAPELPSDLADRVVRSLSASGRQSVRKPFDATGTWRVWSYAVACHVAALLAIVLYQNVVTARAAGEADVLAETMPPGTIGGDLTVTGPGAGDPALPGTADPIPEPPLFRPQPADAAALLPVPLPSSWSQIAPRGGDLFHLRRVPALREDFRCTYGMAASATTVAQGLTWLRDRQDPAHGHFGPLSGDAQRDLAVQSLAILALLGEGVDDAARAAAVRRGLAWLLARQRADADFADSDQITAGLACLALVEGALLFDDPDLKRAAQSALAVLDGRLPLQPGAAGLGGFTLLALETAREGGLAVPARTMEQARRHLGRSLPGQDNDPGRLGLAAFARFIYGRAGNPSTAQQVARLGQLTPGLDATGRADPLGWFFATLALREAHGQAWATWSRTLQASLLACFTTDGATAWVPAQKVRYAETARSGGDVFATSLVLLNLQAPYRYLPLAKD